MMDANNGSMLNRVPGDPTLIAEIVSHVKSQGIFDELRRECLADVDTKPAFQNLRQRVEGFSSNFLSKQVWRPDLNKNQLRDSLRNQLNDSGMMAHALDHLVDQVLNQKSRQLFLPKITEVLYEYLGLRNPNPSVNISAVPPSTAGFAFNKPLPPSTSPYSKPTMSIPPLMEASIPEVLKDPVKMAINDSKAEVETVKPPDKTKSFDDLLKGYIDSKKSVDDDAAKETNRSGPDRGGDDAMSNCSSSDSEMFTKPVISDDSDSSDDDGSLLRSGDKIEDSDDKPSSVDVAKDVKKQPEDAERVDDPEVSPDADEINTEVDGRRENERKSSDREDDGVREIADIGEDDENPVDEEASESESDDSDDIEEAVDAREAERSTPKGKFCIDESDLNYEGINVDVKSVDDVIYYNILSSAGNTMSKCASDPKSIDDGPKSKDFVGSDSKNDRDDDVGKAEKKIAKKDVVESRHESVVKSSGSKDGRDKKPSSEKVRRKSNKDEIGSGRRFIGGSSDDSRDPKSKRKVRKSHHSDNKSKERRSKDKSGIASPEHRRERFVVDPASDQKYEKRTSEASSASDGFGPSIVSKHDGFRSRSRDERKKSKKSRFETSADEEKRDGVVRVSETLLDVVDVSPRYSDSDNFSNYDRPPTPGGNISPTVGSGDYGFFGGDSARVDGQSAESKCSDFVRDSSSNDEWMRRSKDSQRISGSLKPNTHEDVDKMSDVTVSSVHTSDLSSFDDRISLSSGDDLDLNNSFILKVLPKIKRCGGGECSKETSSLVSDHQESFMDGSKMGLRRQRKLNPKYASNEFSSIFNKEKKKHEDGQLQKSDRSRSHSPPYDSYHDSKHGERQTLSPVSDVSLDSSLSVGSKGNRLTSPGSDICHDGNRATPPTKIDDPKNRSNKNVVVAHHSTKRYDSSDLYKPRPVISSSRRSRASHLEDIPEASGSFKLSQESRKKKKRSRIPSDDATNTKPKKQKPSS